MYHLYSSQIMTNHIVLTLSNKHVIFNISQCDNIIYVKYTNFDSLPQI